MILTIWRHGEAGHAADDRRRELTARGHEDVAAGSRRFRDSCTRRDIAQASLLLHSDWTRTTQTAEIVASAAGGLDKRSCSALRPGATVADVELTLEELLYSASPPQHLLLVSHQPLVSRLVDYLCGEVGRVPGLSPGGRVTLELEFACRGGGQVVFWGFPPDYEEGW